MFTIEGSINIVSNLSILNTLALDPKTKIVALVDGSDEFVATNQIPDVSLGSILLPPYKATEYFLNGQYDEFTLEYSNHLYQQESMMLMAVIIASAYFGNNVIIYIPQEQITDFKFVDMLLLHFYNCFGITIGNIDNNLGDSYDKNPNFDATNLNLLYYNDLIDASTFLNQYPINTDFSEYILLALAKDDSVIRSLDISTITNIVQLNSFFKQYVLSIRQYGKVLVSPILRSN